MINSINKDRGSKTVTATLALVLATAFAGNAHAQGNGPKVSIGVLSVCSLDQLPEGGGPALRVDTTIINKTSGDEIPMIMSATITPLQKVKKKTYPLGVAEQDLGIGEETAVEDSVTNTVLIDICAQDPPLMATATSLNALVAVKILEGGKEQYTSKCSDDPITGDIEGGVAIGHLALCQ